MPAPKKNPLTNLIKKGAKKAVTKVKPKPNTKAMPKSNVRVKPAAKTKGNPFNPVKDEVYTLDSSARRNAREPGLWGTVGKAKDARKLASEMKKKYSKKKPK